MHWEQLRLQYLVKGFFDMQTGEARSPKFRLADDLLYLLNHMAQHYPYKFPVSKHVQSLVRNKCFWK